MEEKFPPLYDSEGIESSLYKFWEERGYFSTAAHKRGKEKYVLVIPPPNITGFLHMGHALNNTIQDILVRWKRMEGLDVLWVPGTDHAGIATQNVVEKKLFAETKQGRQSFGRDRFIEEVWKWKNMHGERIIFQLKKLGASCDWERQRFTMDENLSLSVKTAFVKLYEKGLIYKGERIIHWCCRCGTALSDEEVNYEEEDSFLYYLKYPLVDGGFVQVATTRPETMLGDTCVAVHPDDKRYRGFSGKRIKLPFVEREIPVIEDAAVEQDFGTGAVKVTPSHDAADFEIGRRHNLPFVTVINEEGLMNENAGPFKGLDRFKCRESLLSELEKLGLLVKTEPYVKRKGCCYRCDSVIEPYLSSQWFVKMSSLAKPAIEAAEKDVLKFYPERWKKVYLNWLYNIKDWCISRQIWWGHRIPVWYCRDCVVKEKEKEARKGVFVSLSGPDRCPDCDGKDIFQDPDVLDTWFSSWLWPFSVFGWPEKTSDLEMYYPTDTLVTAPEILFFWVARMVMAGYEFMGEAPFENILIHGTVRDETGRKMSKSLGNVIDPLKIIDDYGADSLRFSLVSMTASGQDVFLSPTFYIKGRNFMNKVWNASRFIFAGAEKCGAGSIKTPHEFQDLRFPELWILDSLDSITSRAKNSLADFRLNEALNSLYDFFWHGFCDWYLEISKVYQEKDPDYFKGRVIPVLVYVHLSVIKMLHPFVPFITEKIWQGFEGHRFTDSNSIMYERWPEKTGFKAKSEEMESVMEIVTNIRDLKAKFRIPVTRQISCYFENKPDELSSEIISKLAGVRDFLLFPDNEEVAGNMLVKNLKCGRLGMSFEGIIDIPKELEKLCKERNKLKGYLLKIEGKLSSSEFQAKAPEEVKKKEEKKKTQLDEALANLEKDIDFLKAKN